MEAMKARTVEVTHPGVVMSRALEKSSEALAARLSREDVA